MQGFIGAAPFGQEALSILVNAERYRLFELFLDNYFKQHGFDMKAITNERGADIATKVMQELGKGIEVPVDACKLEVTAQLNWPQSLGITADGLYMFDAGVNGVDKCTINRNSTSDGRNWHYQQPIPLYTDTPFGKALVAAINELQIKSLNLLALYYAPADTSEAVSEYKKSRAAADAMLKPRTSS